MLFALILKIHASQTVTTWKKFYDWSPFFMISFLVALTSAFIFLGFASNFFHFCVWNLFVVASISFEMSMIAWLDVSKLKGTFIGSLLKNMKHFAFTIKLMVILSSIEHLTTIYSHVLSPLKARWQLDGVFMALMACNLI